MECTYKIDGKKISISYKGIKESFDTTFSIDGDKINILVRILFIIENNI